ncbi:MAG: calcium-binding protein, partial [Sphingomonadaceae bacterium]|nr:calcium-binding protein [Sphingomonadaceae bacterium]
ADFTGADEIALLGSVYGLAPVALAPGAFRNGAAAADGNDRIIYNQGAGLIFFDADGNGAGAQVLIAAVSGNPALAAGDFIVI